MAGGVRFDFSWLLSRFVVGNEAITNGTITSLSLRFTDTDIENNWPLRAWSDACLRRHEPPHLRARRVHRPGAQGSAVQRRLRCGGFRRGRNHARPCAVVASALACSRRPRSRDVFHRDLSRKHLAVSQSRQRVWSRHGYQAFRAAVLQPLLVAWALWSTGAWPWLRNKA